MEKPNERQVGGTHYGGREFQHWDWWIANAGVSGLLYAATKYVCRWKNKGTPLADLEKVRHYIEKVLEAHSTGMYPVPWPKGRGVGLFTTRLKAKYNLTETEYAICEKLVTYSQPEELREVINKVDSLISEVLHSGRNQ